MEQRTEVRDPVCDMVIDVATVTDRSVFQGQTFYFCSLSCRETFESNPAHYAARAAARAANAPADKKRAEPPLERHEPRFTKNLDGLVSPKFGSAGSGGAEYELLPEAHDEDKDAR
jgi:Cu+-exporting ATPase